MTSTGTPDGTDLPGALRLDRDGHAVRFERRYATTAEDLWSALTEPDRLARWLAPVTGELAAGGRYRVDFGGGDEATGVVQECRPPHLLVVSWDFPGEPTSRVVVELAAAAAGAGTVLVLDHSRLPADQAVGYGAGWHAYLDGLGDHLTGAAAGDWDARFTALLPAYRDRARPGARPGAGSADGAPGGVGG
ncbi:SRPBCC family protein [Thalassiella azotivora]